MKDNQLQGLRVGVDVGGTFTDVVVSHRSRTLTFKTRSTPDDFARGVVDGIRKLAVQTDAVPAAIAHGSTVATNALLERRGCRVAVITTRGFADILEIGRQNRQRLYDLQPSRPQPLAPAEMRFEVDERVSAEGEVLRPLNPRDVDVVADRVVAAGAEAVAVCLLFSFLHPDHERLVGARLAERGVTVALSCEVCPEFREYERLSTTVINAYVQPVMEGYLASLRERLQDLGAPRLAIMQSNGGVISARTAARQPVRTILSGPAGGVLGGFRVASRSGFENVMTFDMGGTSTDVALCDGRLPLAASTTVNGLPVRTPVLDIHTVGAGGGSIARLDSAGVLRVGPESAGADPGPACYGQGDLPTVTDANLVLGRLPSDRFCGGRMKLHPDRARQTIARLSHTMGTEIEETAAAIVDVVNVNMARALRAISVERGHDPADYALLCFGGAGGLHACHLAEALGIRTVLAPALAGVLSAWGIATADVVRDATRTVMLPLNASGMGFLRRTIDEISEAVVSSLHADTGDGALVEARASLDVRYRGQSYELTVDWGDDDVGSLRQRFDRLHQRRYGYAAPDAEAEVVNVRVRATAPASMPEPSTPMTTSPSGRTCRPRPHRQEVVSIAGPQRADVYLSEQLSPGHVMCGPALVLYEHSTFLLPPDWRGRLDAAGVLVATPAQPEVS